MRKNQGQTQVRTNKVFLCHRRSGNPFILDATMFAKDKDSCMEDVPGGGFLSVRL